MDVHRVVIGEQYYLQLSVGWYPIQCIMNEQMILVNQYLLQLIEREDIVLCVYQSDAENLLTLPIVKMSKKAQSRGVQIGMEAKEALLFLQKEKDPQT